MADVVQQPAPTTSLSDESSDRLARALPRRRFFSDMPDKGLFAIAALAGFGAITLLKVRGVDGNHVALLAVGAMLIYGFIAYQMPAIQLRPDRLGDNFYYLGFIYTLASLSAALFRLSGGAAVDELLGNFGIALVSTIVGIAGRVLFVQMRGELDEIEDRVRRDLAATASDLRGQLSIVLRDFETFRTAIQQSIVEMGDEKRKAQEGAADGIETVAKEAAIRVRSAFEANQSQAERFGAAIIKLTSAAEELSRHAKDIQLPTKQFEKQVLEFGDSLQAIVQRLGGTIEGVAKRVHRRRFWPFGR